MITSSRIQRTTEEVGFPGHCLSNFTKIDGLSSISYHVYSYTRDSTAQTSGTAEQIAEASPSPDRPALNETAQHDDQDLDRVLRTVEWLGRERGILFVKDGTSLWIFDNTHTEHLMSDLLESAQTQIQSQKRAIMVPKASFRSGSLLASALDQRRTPVKVSGQSATPQSSLSQCAPASQPEGQIDAAQARYRMLNQKAAERIEAGRGAEPITTASIKSTENGCKYQEANPVGDESVDVYELFLSAVVALLSYGMTKDQGHLPLNFRTLITPGAPRTLELDMSSDDERPISLMTLEAYLTTSGTLIVGQTLERESGFFRIMDAEQLEMSPDYESLNPKIPPLPIAAGLGKTSEIEIKRSAGGELPDSIQRGRRSIELWLAPGGSIAQYIGPEREDDSPDANPSRSSHRGETDRVRARERLVSQGLDQVWKAELIIWLSRFGIILSGDSHVPTWIRVKVWATSESYTPSDMRETSAPMARVHSILWPLSLCFKRASMDSSSVKVNSGDDLDWFGSLYTKEAMRRDPFSFATEWFRQQEQHEMDIRTAEESRNARAAEAANTQSNAEAEAQALDRNSTKSGAPAGSAKRVLPFAELQAASLIYPTPPDGVQSAGQSESLLESGNSVSGVVSGSVAAAKDPTALADGSQKDDLDLDMDAFDGDDHDLDEDGNIQVVPDDTDFGMPSDEIAPRTGSHLFGDMDEEMFNEPGETDVDFSFFDEPDDEEVFGDSSKKLEQTRTDPATRSPNLVASEDILTSQGPAASATSEMPDSLGSMAAPSLVPRKATEDQHRSNVDVLESQSKREVTEFAPVSNSATGLPTVDLSITIKPTLNPPISPGEIMKNVFPDTEYRTTLQYRARSLVPTAQSCKPAPGSKRGTGTFAPFRFNPMIAAAAQKYRPKGRFGVVEELESLHGLTTTPEGVPKPNGIPLIGLPKTRRRYKESLTLKHISLESILATSRSKSEPEQAVRQSSGNKSNDCTDDDLDDGSDQDDTSETSTELDTTQYTPAYKRKRSLNDDDSSVASSMQSLTVDAQANVNAAIHTSIQLNDLAPDAQDWSMAGLCSITDEHQNRFVAGTEKDFIHLAQIVADHVAFDNWATIDRRTSTQVGLAMGSVTGAAYLDRCCDENLSTMLKAMFDKEVTRCDLSTLSSIADAPREQYPSMSRLSARPNTLPKRPVTSARGGSIDTESSSHPNIMRLPPPHVLVQRGETSMEVLPAAFKYWEILGFGPARGAKDISACCIYPAAEGVEAAADGFLGRLGRAYEGCRLGRHTRVELPNVRSGLVPVVFGEANGRSTLSPGVSNVWCAIMDTFDDLGAVLSQLPVKLQNIVIYFINPFSHASSVVEICAAFKLLFESYQHSLSKSHMQHVNEIVLQIIPISMVASENTIIVLTELEYTCLAMEVYGRCVITEGETVESFPSGQPLSAIILAPSVPESIEFRLTAEPSTNILHENRMMHVAYSVSMDERWVSAAWTDHLGEIQHTVSYCLAHLSRAGPQRTFTEIAVEIWKTTVELIRFKRVHWRLMIAREGVISREEIEAWRIATTTAPTPTSRYRSLSLTLLTVSLPTSAAHLTLNLPSLLPHTIPSAPTPTPFISLANTPPVSTPTPGPNISSPDQYGSGIGFGGTHSTPNTATPGGNARALDPAPEQDPDARLVDHSDDTYMILLPHRRHNTHSVNEHRLSLASGYLIRRAAVHGPLTRPIALGVNIILQLPWVTPPPIRGATQLHAAPPQRESTREKDRPAGSHDPAAVLKEVLAAFRALGVLARLRAIIGSDGLTPWHIAVAERAQRVLSAWM